jgi:hypothetical protein
LSLDFQLCGCSYHKDTLWTKTLPDYYEIQKKIICHTYQEVTRHYPSKPIVYSSNGIVHSSLMNLICVIQPRTLHEHCYDKTISDELMHRQQEVWQEKGRVLIAQSDHTIL